MNKLGNWLIQRREDRRRDGQTDRQEIDYRSKTSRNFRPKGQLLMYFPLQMTPFLWCAPTAVL